MSMRKGYSVVVTSTDASSSRYLFVSKRLLVIFFMLAIAIIVAVVLAMISYSNVYFRALQTEMLKKRNAEMEREFAKLEKIKENLYDVELYNQKILGMLGIEKTPPPVEPGMGGEGVSYQEDIEMPFGTENNIPYLFPTNGQISRDFGPGHEGIDIAAPRFAPVIVTASGIIKETGWDSLYGNYVVVEHNINYSTFYGHLNSTVFQQGDMVAAGAIIGTIGSSGRSTSPHLHYEVRFRGRPVEPIVYIPYFVRL